MNGTSVRNSWRNANGWRIDAAPAGKFVMSLANFSGLRVMSTAAWQRSGADEILAAHFARRGHDCRLPHNDARYFAITSSRPMTNGVAPFAGRPT